MSSQWDPGECIVCGSTATHVFLRLGQVPVHCNVLWPSRRSALRAPKGDIALAYCSSCAHIHNADFRQELIEYSECYENSLHFSPRFQNYAQELAGRLVDRYDLQGKDIIEIGCGQGEFLTLLCMLGYNRGVGFDPSYVPGGDGQETAKEIRFIQDYYSERYAEYAADLICSRHVLEHLPAPTAFLRMVRRTIGSRSSTALFFEVPNALKTFRDLAIWDIIYEHPSYFSPSSLVHAFEASGFQVLEWGEAFDGQFLWVEARPGAQSLDTKRHFDRETVTLTEDVGAFAGRYQEKLQSWRRTVREMARLGQRPVVWGGGSKGVTLLNALEDSNEIRYVVDINPRKRGLYIAGSGQKIVPPEFLQEYRPSVVIVMNPIYEREIQEMVRGLGLTVEFMLA